MDWKTHFVIVRPKRDGTVVVVNEGNSLKDSRYWLNYIAEPYDALHLTPINPKYVGNGDPTYSCHLISRLKTDYNDKAWKLKVFDEGENTKLVFSAPEEKVVTKIHEAPKPALTETEIIQLADGGQHPLSLDEIKAIITNKKTCFKIILAEPTKWIDWESALTLMTKDVYVIGISPDPKWPLTVSLDLRTGKGENMNYADEMKFILKN